MPRTRPKEDPMKPGTATQFRRGTRVRYVGTGAGGQQLTAYGRVVRASGHGDYYVAVPHHSGGEMVGIWSAVNTVRA